MLLQDVWFLEKLAHFDREVIPERRMHAKGSGAFGTFTVTERHHPSAGGGPHPPALSPALAVSSASAEMHDASVRLLRLLDRPDDLAVLGPSTLREIVWRFMQGRDGAVVRQLGLQHSNAPDVRRAIHWLRAHYAEPVRVEDLAQLATMSNSTFHSAFSAVTAMSPINSRNGSACRKPVSSSSPGKPTSRAPPTLWATTAPRSSAASTDGSSARLPRGTPEGSAPARNSRPLLTSCRYGQNQARRGHDRPGLTSSRVIGERHAATAESVPVHQGTQVEGLQLTAISLHRRLGPDVRDLVEKYCHVIGPEMGEDGVLRDVDLHRMHDGRIVGSRTAVLQYARFPQGRRRGRGECAEQTICSICTSPQPVRHGST
jgi:hypothetical protein